MTFLNHLWTVFCDWLSWDKVFFCMKIQIFQREEFLLVVVRLTVGGALLFCTVENGPISTPEMVWWLGLRFQMLF